MIFFSILVNLWMSKRNILLLLLLLHAYTVCDEERGEEELHHDFQEFELVSRGDIRALDAEMLNGKLQ
jgi:hypothetical protein